MHSEDSSLRNTFQTNHETKSETSFSSETYSNFKSSSKKPPPLDLKTKSIPSSSQPGSPYAHRKSNLSSPKSPKPADNDPIEMISQSPFTALVITTLIAFALGFFHFHWLYVVLLLSLLAFRYQRVMTRMKRKLQNNINQELQLEKLETHTETAEWFNHLLSRIWFVYEPILSMSIVENVNWVLDMYKPNFVDSIAMTEFTLGSEAPRILSAKVYPRTEADIVHMDLDVMFSPADETETGKKHRISLIRNSKVVLTTRFGRGLVGVDIPISLKELFFQGKLRVQLKLVSSFAVVKLLEISFLEAPEIDFVLKPMKTFDLMDLPGLSNWMTLLTQELIGSFLVNPNKLTLDLETLMMGNTVTDSAIGVVKLQLHQARHLPRMDTIGTCDGYVKIELNDRELARSKVVSDSLCPHWNETFYFLVFNLKDNLILRVMDYNNLKKDKPIGKITLKLQDLEENEIVNEWRGIMGKDCSKSELNFDSGFYPVVDDQESNAGVLRITLHQAKDLSEKEIDSFVEIYVYSHPPPSTHNPLPSPSGLQAVQQHGKNQSFACHYFRTRTKKRHISPLFEESYEIFVPDLNNYWIVFVVKESRDAIIGGPVAIGEVVLAAKEVTVENRDWFSIKPSESGKIRSTFVFRPIPIQIEFSETSAGIVWLRVNQGRNMKRTELIGKSLVYARASISANALRTAAAPIVDGYVVWDESLYLIIKQKQKQTLILSLLDQNSLSKDELVGSKEIQIETTESSTSHTEWVTLTNSEGRSTGDILVQWSVHLSPETPPSIDEGFKGLFVIHIHNARKLGSKGHRSFSTYCELSVNDTSQYRTRIKKKTDEPSWEEKFEFLITNVKSSKLLISIKESRDMAIDALMGFVSLPLNSIINYDGDGWFPFKNAESGEINLSFEFKVLEGLENAHVAVKKQVSKGFGFLEVDVLRAQDLMAVDAGGTSDPFCVIKLDDEKVMKRTTSPVWNESFEVPLESIAPTFTVELRDWNQVNFSVHLGTVRIDDVKSFADGNEKEIDVITPQGKIQGKLFLKLFFFESGGKKSSTTSSRINSIINPIMITKKLQKKLFKKREGGIEGVEGDGVEGEEEADLGNEINNEELLVQDQSTDVKGSDIEARQHQLRDPFINSSFVLNDSQSAFGYKQNDEASISSMSGVDHIMIQSIEIQGLNDQSNVYIKFRSPTKTLEKTRTISHSPWKFTDNIKIKTSHLQNNPLTIELRTRHKESELLASTEWDWNVAEAQAQNVQVKFDLESKEIVMSFSVVGFAKKGGVFGRIIQ